MEFDRLLSAAADYGFPMLVSSYLLVRMAVNSIYKQKYTKD